MIEHAPHHGHLIRTHRRDFDTMLYGIKGKSNATAESKNTTKPPNSDIPRGFIAEWTITILLLLFGTTTLVQAYVIPSGSMEDTLLIGDHLLVDKLAYAPAGTINKNILPYEDVKRGDIIVFRFPGDIKQTYVKRVVGIPGDRIRLEKKALILNGRKIEEPYKVHKTDYIDSYRDNFPIPTVRKSACDDREPREKRRSDRASPQLLRDGRQPRCIIR